MRTERIISVFVAVSMITSGLLVLAPGIDAGTGFIQPIASPNATYHSMVWEGDGDFMLAAGTDPVGNGVVHKYEPGSGWSSVMNVTNTPFNGIARTEPYIWYDGAENGRNGWSTSNWSGELGWSMADPSTLPPAPASGTGHGQANGGDIVWWFGNTSTGGYSDGSRVASSLYSPVISLPGRSTWGLVSFFQWFEVESDASGDYDIMEVSIKNTTDSGWTRIARWDSGDHTLIDWRQEVINVNGWLGNDIQLNFTFDSVDGSANDYAGWHLDDFMIYTNELYVAVGKPDAGTYSAYFTDGYGYVADIDAFSGHDFNDVAPGTLHHSFMAVGDHGAVFYWYNETWYPISGARANETLTGIDFNGTHFFIVGYDSTGRGVAYYFREGELFGGFDKLHPILGAPDWRLNDIAWDSHYPTELGYGLGAIAANGTVMSMVNPEMWIRESPGTSPPARKAHDMVYVPTQHYFVMFGGLGAGGPLNDTWVYSSYNAQWYNYTSWPSPSPRYGHSMAYDSAMDRIILFGGYDGTGRLNDTWAYYPGNNTWQNISVTVSPSPRYGHGMVYDTVNDRILLFGGDTGTNNDESWEFVNGQWINHTLDVGLAPSPRSSFDMVFSTEHRAIMLFGGQSSGGPLNDTWKFDVNSNTWHKVIPANSPPARRGHTMAFDSRESRVILFGGHDGTKYLYDTWLYDIDTNKWYDPYPGSRPSPRQGSVLAYDPDSGRPRLFGGANATVMNDTWLCSILPAWNGDVVNPAKVTNGENFTAVAWDRDWQDALFVGNDAAGAVVYQFNYGTDYISKVPGLAGLLAGHEIYDVEFRPDDPANRAIAVGRSAFLLKPSMVDSGTILKVNAEYPHIFNIDFRDQATGISRLDQQVDVDHVYTFFAEANYTVGGVDHWSDTSINIAAWYDEGKAGTASGPEPTWSTQDNRSRQFNVTYDVSAGTAVMTYPAGPALEFTVHSTWEDPAVYPGDRHRIYVNISFQAQARMADSQGFAGGAPVSGRIWDRGSALNDPDSWDFTVRIYDENSTGVYNETYGEFGVKETVSVTVSGNPTGNAPPGTFSNPMANPSQITYSANTQYWVNVSIPDLVASGIGTIGATNVNVSNSNLLASDTYSDINAGGWAMGRPFTAANTSWSVWGTRSGVGQWMPAPANGTYSFGPWGSDYNAGWVSAGVYTTQLDWWVTVPAGTPEGIYTAIITIGIDS